MEFAGEIMGMVGTIASIAALWIIFQNNSTAVRLNRSERFKNAVEQLGSGKNPVVLGAIYSLHRIAGEDETYRENVFSILCAYVRDTTAEDSYQKKYTEKPSEPVQAVLNLLCLQPKDRVIYQKAPQNYEKFWAFTKKYLPLGKDKEPEQKAGPWLKINFERSFLRGANLNGADLKTALLSGVNLDGAILSGARLEEVDLSHAHLKGANLSKAHLQKANLFNTYLEGANLSHAHLEGVFLSGAHLEGVNLYGAHLKGVFLYGAYLQEANLSGAHLEEANLSYAQLQAVYLSNANLQGADLTGAFLQGAYLSNAHLQKANLSGTHLEGADSLSIPKSWYFEKNILSRVGKQTDLSGIDGFDPQNPPYLGKPILGTLSRDMAEDIINKRREALDKKTPEKN